MKNAFSRCSGSEIKIVAGRGMVLEKHKGILNLSDDRIEIAVDGGSVVVSGIGLHTGRIDGRFIFIYGIISLIELR